MVESERLSASDRKIALREQLALRWFMIDCQCQEWD